MINTLLNLILYNPLEALLIVLFVYIVSNKSFKMSKSIFFYIFLGSINFIFQNLTELFNDNMGIFVISLFEALVTLPLILYLYILNFCKEKVKLFLCFLAGVFNFITIYIGVYICEIFSVGQMVFVNKYIDVISELNINITIKIVQFLLIIFVKLGVDFYEKVFKKYCNE